MNLLERDGQLRQLEAALERASLGRGTTVLVSGEAGVGKTSLLQAFAAHAGETARVLVPLAAVLAAATLLTHRGHRREQALIGNGGDR
jgi:tRNA A37 threonylcarbamoyladenosine biosynthesis protein TsaE